MLQYVQGKELNNKKDWNFCREHQYFQLKMNLTESFLCAHEWMDFMFCSGRETNILNL